MVGGKRNEHQKEEEKKTGATIGLEVNKRKPLRDQKKKKGEVREHSFPS